MKNFTKSIKIWEACSTDKMRPALSYIQFRDGYALASDAHIAVRVPLKYIADISDEEIEKLNGKEIGGKAFSELAKIGIATVEDDAVVYTKSNVDTRYYFRKQGEGGNMPGIQGLFDGEANKEAVPTRNIMLNPANIKRLSSAMGISGKVGIRMRFGGESKAIFCTGETNEIQGIIMPMI